MPPLSRRLIAAAAIIAGASPLAGCQQGTHFAPACPSLSLLPDAADLTRYRAGGQDITDLVVDARITTIPAKCSAGEPGKVDAVMRVNMAVQRGPAATSRTIPVPYFVAVTDGNRVLDKQDYTLLVRFPPNLDQTLASGDEINMILPVTRDKSAAAYSIYVGYTLTPDELALNRKRGPR
jgi:hypothetical protein